LDRLSFVWTLGALDSADFESIVASIPGASRHVGRQGTIPEKAAELMRWAESPTGPGLDALQEALDRISGGPSGVPVRFPFQTELELGRKATKAFQEEIEGMIQRDDIDRALRRMLAVAMDISRDDFRMDITIAINNIKEIRNNKHDKRYYAQKNNCLRRIMKIAQGIAELLDSASAGGVGSRAFPAAGGE